MQATALFHFKELRAEIGVLTTADVREIIDILEDGQDWFEVGHHVQIDGKRYEIEHIVIEPFITNQPRFFRPDPNNPMEKGMGYSWNTHVRVYLSPPKP